MSRRVRLEDGQPALERTVDWAVWNRGRGVADVACRCEIDVDAPRDRAPALQHAMGWDPGVDCGFRPRAMAVRSRRGPHAEEP